MRGKSLKITLMVWMGCVFLALVGIVEIIYGILLNESVWVVSFGGMISILSLVFGFVLYKTVTKPSQKALEAIKALNVDPFFQFYSNKAKAIDQKNDLIELPENIAQFGQTVREKMNWYVGILDSIPFPLSVTDMDMNWTLINKPVEQFLKIKRETVMGHQCSEWNADICKTENCGVARLRKNYLQTFFDQQGGNFQVDTSYLYSLQGEKIGHVEVVQDITRLISGNKYQELAISQIADYLNQLSQGNLAFSINELPQATDAQLEVKKKIS